MTGPTYTAPYTRTITVLHIADDGADPPATQCGQPMASGEIWLPVQLMPGERVCPDCEAGYVTMNGELW